MTIHVEVTVNGLGGVTDALGKFVDLLGRAVVSLEQLAAGGMPADRLKQLETKMSELTDKIAEVVAAQVQEGVALDAAVKRAVEAEADFTAQLSTLTNQVATLEAAAGAAGNSDPEIIASLDAIKATVAEMVAKVEGIHAAPPPSPIPAPSPTPPPSPAAP
jgi:hypothetical protein